MYPYCICNDTIVGVLADKSGFCRIFIVALSSTNPKSGEICDYDITSVRRNALVQIISINRKPEFS